jgi:Leucine-rich repeat (LRR) protein
MANISLTNPQNIKSLLLSSSPKLGGKIDISVFSNLEDFSCENNEVVEFTGNNVISTLKTLNISYNFLSAALGDVDNNVNLETFKCNNNNITGTFPDISRCVSLDEISAGVNQITGSLPNTFGCPNITKLYLNDNLFSSLTSSQIIDINLNNGTGTFVENEKLYQFIDGIRLQGTISKIITNGPNSQLYITEIQAEDESSLLFSSGAGYTDIFSSSNILDVSNTYTATIQSDKYYIDNNETPAIYLTRGKVYKFVYPASNQIKFSTTIDGTHGGGVEYTDGITIDTVENELLFAVPLDAPESLFYYGSTADMGGGVLVTSGTVPAELINAYNSVTGFSTSIPVVPQSLQYGYFQNNSLVLNLDDLFQDTYSGTPALIDFRASNNSITGFIPDLSVFTNLSYFDISSNSVANFIGDVGSILVYFNASNNALNQTAVDNLLEAFDEAGQENGNLLLNGGTNSAPTNGATNSNYLSLISKGWTITIN